MAGAFVCAAVLVGIVAALRPRTQTTDPSGGSRVVAVLPFRVTAADSSLAFLREGMVDLLAVRLSGTGYLRTVDPQTLLGAWARAGGTSQHDLDRSRALELARRFGAGWLLQGSVTGTSRRVVLSATLVDSSGQERVQASLDGPYDSLVGVVDRLAAQLLALSAGEPRQHLAALTTTTLSALRAYLEGRASYRRGSFGKAVTEFALATQLDSTFALAGLGRTEAAKWDQDRQPDRPGSLLAWRNRARLSERDKAFLYAIVGPRFPRVSSVRQLLRTAENKVAAAPDSPEAWASLGDFLYHYGAELGLVDADQRSLRAYETALTFDSLYAPALEHLGPLYAKTGDTSAIRRSINRLLRLDSVSSHSAANRFYASLVLGDEAMRRGHNDQDSLLSQSNWLASMVAENGVGRDLVDSLIGIRERTGGLKVATDYYLLRGWPQRARRVGFKPDDIVWQAHTLLMLTYTDGDSAQARALATGLRHLLSRTLRGFEEEEALFSLAQYDLTRGHKDTARIVSATLRRIRERAAPLGYGYLAPYFALLLETQLAALAGDPRLRSQLETLDTVLQSVPATGLLTTVGNLVVARLWDRQGEHQRGLEAIRRRKHNEQRKAKQRHQQECSRENTEFHRPRDVH
jgi:TolB-like protein